VAPVSESGSPSNRWRFPDLVLAELLAVTVLWAAAVAVWGAAALPWTTAAERDGAAYRDAAAAAERGVLAFLDIDYRDIDDRSNAVIKLSTGAFRDEYTFGTTDLRIATMRARSISSGTVRAVAVKDVEGPIARVLVGAEAVVRNSATRKAKATEDCPHTGARCDRFRYLVTLTDVDGAWLMSGLAEVP
jgi:hypothetical protein